MHSSTASSPSSFVEALANTCNREGVPFSALPPCGQRIIAQAFLIRRWAEVLVECAGLEEATRLFLAGEGTCASPSFAHAFTLVHCGKHPTQPQVDLLVTTAGFAQLLLESPLTHHLREHRHYLACAMKHGFTVPSVSSICQETHVPSLAHALVCTRRTVRRAMSADGNLVVRLNIDFPYFEGTGVFSISQDFCPISPEIVTVQ